MEKTNSFDEDLVRYEVQNLLHARGLHAFGNQYSGIYGEYYFSRKLLDTLSVDSAWVATWLQMNKKPNPFDGTRSNSTVPLSGRFLDIASRGMEKWIELYVSNSEYSTIPCHIFEIDEKAAIAVYEYVVSLNTKALFVMPEKFGLTGLSNLPQELKDEALVRWPDQSFVAETLDNFSADTLNKIAREQELNPRGDNISSLLNPFLSKAQTEVMLEGIKRNSNLSSSLKQLEFEKFPIETASRIADALFSVSRHQIAQLKVNQLINAYIRNRFFTIAEKRELVGQFVRPPSGGTAASKQLRENVEFQFMLYEARIGIQDPARLEELFDEYLTHSLGETLCFAIVRNPYCPPHLLAHYAVRVNNSKGLVRDIPHEEYVEKNFFHFKLKQEFYTLFLEEDKKEFEEELNQILAKNGMNINSSPLSWKLTTLDFLIEAELASAPQVLFPGYDDPFGNDDPA